MVDPNEAEELDPPDDVHVTEHSGEPVAAVVLRRNLPRVLEEGASPSG